MKHLLNKLKRLEPLIRLREKEVDSEKQKLQEIRIRKKTVTMKMKEKQREYLAGVEHLNRLRTSTHRENLIAMESALDTVKIKWNELFVTIQEIEKEEDHQLSILLQAQTRSKSMEKLKSSHQEDLQKERSILEQKQLDELTILRERKHNEG